jgi:hypothetical protein
MAVAEGRAVPLSEQLLARLPGPGRLWVAAWLLVPWLSLLVVWATEANGQGVPRAEVLNRAAVTFSVAVWPLWGATRVPDDLHRPPVGRLAFTGFWMIFGSVAPLVVTGFSDVPGAIVGTGLLVVAVGMFFLSLRDLHQRMVAVKEQELRRATTLYQVAYEKVRREPTPEVLQRDVDLLNAAEAMEKRAERILAWPFDEVTLARVITIVSSAVAVILARILLAPTGL